MEGIERIKILAAEIKNKATLKVIEYLISRKDMNNKYLNEEKSLKQMIDFIRNEAKKQAEDNCAMLEDEEVFSFAIHYWDETNENLGLVKKEKIIEKVKTVKEEKIINVNKKNDDSKKWVPEGQLSLF